VGRYSVGEAMTKDIDTEAEFFARGKRLARLSQVADRE